MRTFKCTACNDYDFVGIEIDDLTYMPSIADGTLDLLLWDETRNRVNYRLRSPEHEKIVEKKLEELRGEDPSYKSFFCFNCGMDGTVILI